MSGGPCVRRRCHQQRLLYVRRVEFVQMSSMHVTSSSYHEVRAAGFAQLLGMGVAAAVAMRCVQQGLSRC
jgi:hypothetical protein